MNAESRESPREAHPLRVYRARRSLSMQQLAVRAAVSVAGLSRIEKCEITPSLPTMLRLAAACEGEVSDVEIFKHHAAAVAERLGMALPRRDGCCGG